MPPVAAVRLLRSQFTVPVSRGDVTIDEKVAAGEECAVRPYQPCSEAADLIRCAGVPGHAQQSRPAVKTTLSIGMSPFMPSYFNKR